MAETVESVVGGAGRRDLQIETCAVVQTRTVSARVRLCISGVQVEKGGCDMEHCSLAYADAFDHRRYSLPAA